MRGYSKEVNLDGSKLGIVQTRCLEERGQLVEAIEWGQAVINKVCYVKIKNCRVFTLKMTKWYAWKKIRTKLIWNGSSMQSGSIN